jgi:hypothetical protein
MVWFGVACFALLFCDSLIFFSILISNVCSSPQHSILYHNMKLSFWAFAALVAAIKFTPVFALAPSAGPDFATTTNVAPVNINVLANDFREPSPTDPPRPADPATDTLSMLSTPSSGSVAVVGNGVVTYTPVVGFTGTTSFTYVFTVNDMGDANNGLKATGTVTVTVVNVPGFSPANAVFLTQNTLTTFGLRGSATNQAQFQNAISPVLNAPTSFFPVFDTTNTPQFASGLNSVNANFAAVFANFPTFPNFFGN